MHSRFFGWALLRPIYLGVTGPIADTWEGEGTGPAEAAVLRFSLGRIVGRSAKRLPVPFWKPLSGL